MNKTAPPAASPNPPPEHFRPLKWNERVQRGDFVRNEQHGYDLWEGPAGFRADAFVKQIYRRLRGTANEGGE